MQALNTKTIREIALEMPATTRVFENHKIDYCCGGRRSVAEACEAAGIDPALIFEQLDEIVEANVNGPESIRWESREPEELIDHIVDTHHVFTRNELGRLGALMEKVCTRHGDAHSELFDLKKGLAELTEDLMPHMTKEETVLFPFIRRLSHCQKRDLLLPVSPFGTVQNPVRMMMFEHETAGEILRKMRKISGDYRLPEGACPSYTALFFGIQELEKDLHRHIHLENNVLFPHAIELETKIKTNVVGELATTN